MNKISREILEIVLLTVILLGVIPAIRAVEPPETVPAPCMYLVGPSGTGSETFYTNNTGVGSTFNVTAWINTTYDEAGWGAALFFSNSQLNVVSVAFTANGSSQSAWFYDQGITGGAEPIRYNNSTGTIGEPLGSGEVAAPPWVLHAAVDTLFTITFEVMTVPPPGSGNYLTSEVDWDQTVAFICTTFGTPDPNASFGNFKYILANPPPDVAVTNVVPGKTVVGQGYNMNVTVTAANMGINPEIVNVTLYANATIYLDSQNVTLSVGASANVTLVWNATGFAKGNYTISAYAWPAPDETYTDNNNFTDGWVIVAIPCDITSPNGWPDGTVNMRDIALVARTFGSTPESSNWNGNADFNNDGRIDMRDIALIARHFGNTDP